MLENLRGSEGYADRQSRSRDQQKGMQRRGKRPRDKRGRNGVTAVRSKEAETNAVECLRNLVGREAQADRQSEGRDQQN